MSRQHRRPLMAFITVTVLCLLLLGRAVRSEALEFVPPSGQVAGDQVRVGDRVVRSDPGETVSTPPTIAVDIDPAVAEPLLAAAAGSLRAEVSAPDAGRDLETRTRGSEPASSGSASTGRSPVPSSLREHDQATARQSTTTVTTPAEQGVIADLPPVVGPPLPLPLAAHLPAEEFALSPTAPISDQTSDPSSISSPDPTTEPEPEPDQPGVLPSGPAPVAVDAAADPSTPVPDELGPIVP